MEVALTLEKEVGYLDKNSKVAILQDVLRIKSVNDREEEVALYLQTLLEKNGIATELVEYSPGRSNLIATLEGKEAGKTLGFTGHLDVVAAGDESEWIHPPFDAVIDGTKLYGRGSTDMKGGTVGLVLAMIELKEKGIPFKGRIKLLATVGEEIGTIGAKQLTELGYADDLDGLIIAEPSSANSFVTAHKGSMSYKVTSTGKASHSSMPQEGINAIVQLNQFILQANEAMAEITAQYENPKLGRTTHAVTIIRGGEQINSIPDKATVEGNIRSIPEYDNNQILALFDSIVENINGVIEGKLAIEFTQNNMPVDEPNDTDLVKAAERAVGKLPIIGISPTTDGAQFTQSKKKFDFLLHGPGIPTLPHQINEYIEIDDYLQFIDRFQAIALEYLN